MWAEAFKKHFTISDVSESVSQTDLFLLNFHAGDKLKAG
jgi:hypothetical protein